MDLFQQVVNLVFRRAHLDLGVQQAGGADDLFHIYSARFFQFVVGRSSRHVDGLVLHGLEFLEFERAVVDGCRQAESVLHQGGLAAAVASVHGLHLRDGYVALVDHHQKIFGEIVQQAERAAARFPAVQVSGVVLDAGAVSQLADHFQVELRTLLQPFCFQKLSGGGEVFHTLSQVDLDLVDGVLQAVFSGYEDVGRIDAQVVVLGQVSVGRGIRALDLLDTVAKEVDTHRSVGIRGEDIDRIAFDPEISPGKIARGAAVQSFSELVQETGAGDALSHFEVDDALFKLVRVADPVEARHGSHHDHVPARGEQRRHGRKAEFFDVFVDREVFLDVGAGRRDVSLGLVVVVIRNEVFDGVFREKSLELRVELGGQGLVVSQHEGRAAGVLDDVGYGEGLSRAGYPQQGLGRKAAFDPLGELADGFRLVAGRTVVAGEFELHGKRLMFFPRLSFAWDSTQRGEK